jgi:hypothetical protein
MKRPAMRRVVCAITMLLLAACSDGGGGGGIASTCQYVGGSTNCNNGRCNYSTRVSDSDLQTFGLVEGATGAFLSTHSGAQFPSGVNVGAFVTLPAGVGATDITLQTTLGGDLNVVESATGVGLSITPTAHDPATEYVSFTSNAPFDGVRFVVNAASSKEYLVFEFCGAATVK